jgi:bifunctional non-homologous end joining protein LigD
MCAVALRRPVRSHSAASLPGARRTPFPSFIVPCDPTLRQAPPTGDDWLYEIKADGYRAQAHVHRGIVTVYSSKGFDWTEQFSAIAQAIKSLESREAVIDGEAIVLGNTGLPDFQALRRELSKNSGRLQYHAFDLLYLNGYDLQAAPYVERKRLLQQLLEGAREGLVYVEYLDPHAQDVHGQAVFKHACRMGLEGVIAKKRDSPYRSGRTENWIKLKCVKSDNFPIVAFVEKLGAHPRKIASLYLGRREGNRLLYAGKARSGYTEQMAREVRERLDPLISKRSPLSEPINKPKATWIRPELDAEIQYGGITDEGLLREAVFKGLREDLVLPTLRAPRIAPAPMRKQDNEKRHGVPRENILQLLPEAVAPSTEELAAYWNKAATRALVYLGRRPLKLVRHTQRTTFYHKGKLPPIPDSVHQLRIEKREGGEGVRVWVDDLAGLLGLVEMDAVELHPWAATVDDIERPDRLVFDLDPGPGVAWEFVIETALVLKRMLEDEGYESWPKLTGGKGLHLMVPIEPQFSHDHARVYCKRIAQRLESTAPDKYTTSPVPAQRYTRIYIDYLRNGRGTTAVGTYSPRVQRGFPIAAPVTWEQVADAIAPNAFTIKRLPRR